VLLYVAFTVAWTVVRAAIEAQGVYANHRTQCLKDFERTCGNWVDIEPFRELFGAWDAWESGTHEVEAMIGWCDGVARAAAVLQEHLGVDDPDAFTGWPTRTI
jgi:hypothetical protein